MKTIYTLKTSVFNGSVTMFTHCDNFISKELAKKTKKMIEEKNKSSQFGILCDIQESMLFEDESEVNILNK